MKKSKKFLLCMLMTTIAVAAVMGLGCTAEKVYAAGGVYFQESYVKSGDTLTVKYGGDNNGLSYVWYADDEKIASNSDADLEITNDHYQKTIRAEVWNGTKKLGETSMFCSKLPVLYIDTKGGADIVSKEDYLDATMHLQGNEEYNSSKILYTGATEIKGRGNSTWEYFPKKPYKLKLDKKTDLFGLGKNKHWVLLANYIDESGVRNMIAGDVATRMGVGAMDGTWVELVLNGRNLGMYMLCEHVRLSEDRVNVFDWESAAEDLAEAIAEANGLSEDDMDDLTDQMAEEDMSWISSGEVTFKGQTYKTAEYYEDLPEAFTGGYLLEMDYGYDEVSKFTTTKEAPIMFKSPEFINTDEVAMSMVQDYIQTFEDAIYSADFNTESGDRTVSYTELCDMDSLVNFWLTSELFMNEIGTKSTYMQKDIDQPLVFGPVWDFDFSSGSVSPFSAHNPTDWTSDNRYDTSRKEKWWFLKIMRDPYFSIKVREAYMENADYLHYVIADDGLLDQWHEYLKEAGEYNSSMWSYAKGFEADYQALDKWLTTRINWMDGKLATNASAMKSMGISFSSKLTLKLQGETVNSVGTNAYTSKYEENVSYDLLVTAKDSTYPEASYYINSKYQGTVPVVDKKATIVIRPDQLTEDLGKDNVITVWLRDAEGKLALRQYVTVKLTTDRDYCNVVCNDMGSTRSSKVLAGDKVYLDTPAVQEANYVFEGWSDGVNTYPAGKWLTVSDDMFLNAVWTMCTNGEYAHELVKDGDLMKCTREGCTASKSFKATGIDISACILSVSNRLSNTYNGSEITPEIGLVCNNQTLVQGEDYTVTYYNNINAGYGTYKVAAVEGSRFKGEYVLSFRILPRDISKIKIRVPSKCELVNGVAEPAVTVTYKDNPLVEGTDYDVVYTDNTTEGTGTVQITGKGNFTGSVTKTFTVTKPVVNINDCNVTVNTDTKAYTGEAVKTTVTVKDGKVKLAAGSHYHVTYKNNVECGTATVTITGVTENGYKGSKSVTFKIRPAKTTAKVTNVKYNQQKVTWTKVAGATDYRVFRSTDNKNFTRVKIVKAGESCVYNSKSLKTGQTYYYKVRAVTTKKVSGKSTDYLGDFSAVVKAKPALKKGNVKSVENSKAGTATIKWTGVEGANGYLVYRSTTNKTGSFKVIKNVKSGLTKSYKNTKLKKGKTYYYKVRPYRNVNGKVVYGGLSGSKGIKIKK